MANLGCIMACFCVAVAQCATLGPKEQVRDAVTWTRLVDSVRVLEESSSLLFQRGGVVNLSSFSWNDCNKPSTTLKVTSLDVTPDPIMEGAQATASVTATMAATVPAPIEAVVLLQYHIEIVGWYTVPCKNNVGSCTYADICKMLPKGTCPITKGVHKVNNSFQVPTSIPSGSYRATVNVNSNGKWLACMQIDAQADVLLQYSNKIIGWTTVPCKNGVGSCTYSDICTKLPRGTSCPITKGGDQEGVHKVKNSFQVPTSIPAGSYRATVNVRTNGNEWLACVQNVALVSK